MARSSIASTLELLRQELDWAVSVSVEDTPADVITMGTQVWVHDIVTGQRQDYIAELAGASDQQAPVAHNRLSVIHAEFTWS
jgi:hypothetical protein